MARIAGVVVVYNPDPGLQQRIDSYLPRIERLFIYDNSDKPYGPPPGSDKIIYIQNNGNKGIAAGLNEAARMAIAEKFDWLLTMDQDSYFSEDNLTNYLDCFSRFVNKNDVAAFGVGFENEAAGSTTCETEETTHLITSGTLINLALYNLIGPFEEGLFIDHVDYDYLFRANMKGYKTVRFKNVFLYHQLGVQSEHRSFLTFRKTKRSLHAPVRMYYMTRNYLFMRSKYRRHFPKEIRHLRKDLLYRLKNNLLYSPKRFGVIRYFLSGIRDYYRNKMGKY